MLDDDDALPGALAVTLTLTEGDAVPVGATPVAVAFALLVTDTVPGAVTDGVGAAPAVTVTDGDASLDTDDDTVDDAVGAFVGAAVAGGVADILRLGDARSPLGDAAHDTDADEEDDAATVADTDDDEHADEAGDNDAAEEGGTEGAAVNDGDNDPVAVVVS